MIIQKVIITDWNHYRHLTEEEMLYLLFQEDRTVYEVAAISCPPDVPKSCWFRHYYRVSELFFKYFHLIKEEHLYTL